MPPWEATERSYCKDRTYKRFSLLSKSRSPSFGWGSVLLSVPRSLLLGLSLRSGPSSLLLSPSPSHCTDYPVSMVAGPREGSARKLRGHYCCWWGEGYRIGIKEEQKVSSSSQRGQRPVGSEFSLLEGHEEGKPEIYL